MDGNGTVNKLPGLLIKLWVESYVTSMILVPYYCVMFVSRTRMLFSSYPIGCDLMSKFIMSLVHYKEISYIFFVELINWYMSLYQVVFAGPQLHFNLTILAHLSSLGGVGSPVT